MNYTILQTLNGSNERAASLGKVNKQTSLALKIQEFDSVFKKRLRLVIISILKYRRNIQRRQESQSGFKSIFDFSKFKLK